MGICPKKTSRWPYKAPEKMLSITNYWRNANQNWATVSPHTPQNSHPPKDLQGLNAAEGEGEQGILLHCGQEWKWAGAATKDNRMRIPLNTNHRLSTRSGKPTPWLDPERTLI